MLKPKFKVGTKVVLILPASKSISAPFEIERVFDHPEGGYAYGAIDPNAVFPEFMLRKYNAKFTSYADYTKLDPYMNPYEPEDDMSETEIDNLLCAIFGDDYDEEDDIYGDEAYISGQVDVRLDYQIGDIVEYKSEVHIVTGFMITTYVTIETATTNVLYTLSRHGKSVSASTRDIQNVDAKSRTEALDNALADIKSQNYKAAVNNALDALSTLDMLAKRTGDKTYRKYYNEVIKKLKANKADKIDYEKFAKFLDADVEESQ